MSDEGPKPGELVAHIEVPRGHTRASMLRTLDRELALRRVVYPKRMQLGQMTEDEAAAEMASMQAVRDTIAQLPSPQGKLPGVK